jgi:hypothetical protein
VRPQTANLERRFKIYVLHGCGYKFICGSQRHQGTFTGNMVKRDGSGLFEAVTTSSQKTERVKRVSSRAGPRKYGGEEGLGSIHCDAREMRSFPDKIKIN